MAETLVRDALVLDAKLVQFAVGLANASDGFANCSAAALWTIALVAVRMLSTIDKFAFVLRADFLLVAMFSQPAFRFRAFVLDALLNLRAVFSVCTVVMSSAVNFGADFLFRDVIDRANVLVQSDVLAVRAGSTRRRPWLLTDEDLEVAAVSDRIGDEGYLSFSGECVPGVVPSLEPEFLARHESLLL